MTTRRIHLTAEEQKQLEQLLECRKRDMQSFVLAVFQLHWKRQN